MRRTLKKMSSTRGQAVFLAIGLLPLYVVAMIIIIDFGNFMIMRNYARTAADMAALSGAGALDLKQVQTGRYVLHPVWARERAEHAFDETIKANDLFLGSMTFTIQSISVNGPDIEVIVFGTVVNTYTQKIWPEIRGYHTIAVGRAHAATGIEEDLSEQ